MSDINYTAIVEKIRNIFLDYRTTIHDKSWQDEDGKHYDYELDCLKAQEKEVEDLLRVFLSEEMQVLVSNIFATEDAKKAHYE